MKTTALFLLSAFLSQFAYSASIEDVFEQLKDSGESFVVVGSICEQVARLKLGEKYSDDQYDVRTGIAYSNKNRTLGELDVVVFNDSDRAAILIAEVKCWRNLSGAHKKAREQRRRFQKWIESDANLRFFPASRGQDRYEQDQFETRPEFISISQAGGESAGFEMSLDFSLEELMSLRRRLMKCQEAGECRRPEKPKRSS